MLLLDYLDEALLRGPGGAMIAGDEAANSPIHDGFLLAVTWTICCLKSFKRQFQNLYE